MIITYYNHEMYCTDCTLVDHYQIYCTDCTLHTHYKVQPWKILFWLYTWWTLPSTTIKYTVLTVHFMLITKYNLEKYYSIQCTVDNPYLVQPSNKLFWLYISWTLRSTTMKYLRAFSSWLDLMKICRLGQTAFNVSILCGSLKF